MKAINSSKSLLVCVLFILNNIIYNQCRSQTTQLEGECTSAPGQNEKLYHTSSGKCYEFATRGPCGKNMIFYKHPVNPKYGFCDCDQGVKSQYPCKDHPIRKIVYLPTVRKCFPIFSQGPCEDGFWLNYKAQSTQAECQPNSCIQIQSMMEPRFDWKGNNSTFWYHDPLRNGCYRSRTRGYCPVGLTLEITHDSHLPKCRRKKCYSKLTNFRSDLSCRPGSRYSYLFKGCVKSARKYFGIG